MALTLRQWRLAKEISQETMAEKLGIHTNTYRNWEEAPEKISIKDVEKIVYILDVPLDNISFCSQVNKM